MSDNSTPKNAEEAIYQIYGRMISLETTLRGTPNTQEGGLVATVQEIKNLAIEGKNSDMQHGQRITRLEARCIAFHGGEKNNTVAIPRDSGENGVVITSKKRFATFIGVIATIIALAIYNLGAMVGWWKTGN